MNWTVFNVLLSPYNIDEKWYPFILIGLGVIFLILVYVIFVYIKYFITWINSNSELIKLQKENNLYLQELLEIQDYQAEQLEKILEEITNNKENKNFEENEKPKENNKENEEDENNVEIIDIDEEKSKK